MIGGYGPAGAAAAIAAHDAGRTGLNLAVWRRVQAVNVESALLLAQAFVPGMAARAFGRIIFVVSDTVWAPPAADLLPYVTSKGALATVAFLASDGAAALTGQVLCTDGGLVMR